MGIFEWLIMLVFILLYTHRLYRTQEYWLDRKVAQAIRCLKKWFFDRK